MKLFFKKIKDLFTQPWIHHGFGPALTLLYGAPYLRKGSLALITQTTGIFNLSAKSMQQSFYKNNSVKWWHFNRLPHRHLVVTDREDWNVIFPDDLVEKNHYTSTKDTLIITPINEYYFSSVLRSILYQCTRPHHQVQSVIIDIGYGPDNLHEFTDFICAVRGLAAKHKFAAVVFRTASVG